MDGQPRTGVFDVGADQYMDGVVLVRMLTPDDVGPLAQEITPIFIEVPGPATKIGSPIIVKSWNAMDQLPAVLKGAESIISIYNPAGRLVRTVIAGEGGFQQNTGIPLSPGMHILRIVPQSNLK